MADVFLTDGERAILAWPLTQQPVATHPVLAANGPTARFREQVDLRLLRQASDYLRQEIERQRRAIDQTRRQLPRGWYRNSNPTADLEIISATPVRSSRLDLPKVWPDHYHRSSHSS